jgi:hypothetical protein
MAVPTNTVDVEVPISKNMNSDFTAIFPAGEQIQGLDFDTKYVMNDATTDGKYYFCPFDINVMLAPFKKTRYLYTMTNSKSSAHSTTFSNEKTSPTASLVADSIKVYRGMDYSGRADKYYKVTITLSSNQDLK